MAKTDEDENKRFGCITVTNIGRRPIFISHVALKLPKGSDTSHFLILRNPKGQMLAEGDAPAILDFDQDGLKVYSKKWQNVVAQVSDSTGKVWLSPRVKKKPSWAKITKRNNPNE